MSKAVVVAAFAAVVAAKDVPLFLPQGSGLSAAQIGIVINVRDPQSVAVGAAYQKARTIPGSNVVQLNFSTGEVLSQAEFFPAFAALSVALPSTVQALALTWLWPYRVDCMSVTSAFALNFSEKYCGASGSALRSDVSIRLVGSRSLRRELPALHADGAFTLLQLVFYEPFH